MMETREGRSRRPRDACSRRGVGGAIFAGTRIGLCGLLLFVLAAGARAQVTPGPAPPSGSAASPAAVPAPAPADPLGRATPHGAVVGFLSASRKGDFDLAAQYLNGRSAGDLARQLFTILDARLPTVDLLQLNDTAEGSRENPLAPNQERIATIHGPDGPVDIVLERVTRPKVGSVWLFSRDTLDEVPGLYEDVASTPLLRFVPRALSERRLGGVRLFDWIAMALGIAALYLLTNGLNRLLTWAGASLSAKLGRPRLARGDVLPLPARLLIVATAGRWLVLQLELSLRVRQFVSNAAAPLTIGVVVWLGLALVRDVERHILRKIPGGDTASWLSLARLGRRLLDAIILVVGVIWLLKRFGIDPTPVLAGVGVGGIAIALAAQKTLENVIAGASLIVDQAVRVGDVLKAGEILGTVDYIGLRSTRIRTPDRTVVTVPNGQIANMTLETVSARDKFWFHPTLTLRYETTSGQMHVIIESIRSMLVADPRVEAESVRVSFLRMGPIGLDVEIAAYFHARDWGQFVDIQERVLLRTMEIVDGAGAQIASPWQLPAAQFAVPR